MERGFEVFFCVCVFWRQTWFNQLAVFVNRIIELYKRSTLPCRVKLSIGLIIFSIYTSVELICYWCLFLYEQIVLSGLCCKYSKLAMIPAVCLQPCWESLAIDFSLCLSVSLIQREQMKIAKSLRSAPLRKLRKRSWENGYCYLHVYLCALVIANNNIFFVVLVLVMDVCKCWVVGWCMLIHFFSSKPIKKPSFYSNYVIKETDVLWWNTQNTQNHSFVESSVKRDNEYCFGGYLQ